MAYDEKLAIRMRNALQAEVGSKGQKALSEKRMMGGLCFLLNGNMVGGADRTKDGVGRFLFRVGKENHDSALKLPGAEPMVMGGRTMSGFIFVNADECKAARLKKWIKLAADFAAGLEPK